MALNLTILANLSVCKIARCSEWVSVVYGSCIWKFAITLQNVDLSLTLINRCFRKLQTRPKMFVWIWFYLFLKMSQLCKYIFVVVCNSIPSSLLPNYRAALYHHDNIGRIFLIGQDLLWYHWTIDKMKQ